MPAENKYTIKVDETGAKRTRKALNGVNSSLSSMATKVIGVSAVYFGAKGLIRGLTSTTSKAGEFQKGIAEVGTLLGQQASELSGMAQGLKGLSVSFGQTLDTLAKAQYDAISAGFTDIADSQKLLASASMLAVGGVSDVATTTDVLTSALNAYGLTGADAVDVSDSLFTTVRLGKTTVTELSASLGKAIPFAKSAGLSMDDLGASMALMTTKGINTAETTTALSSLFRNLAMPTAGVREAMQEAGIEIVKTDDGATDLIGTLRQFEGLDPALMAKVAPDVGTKLAIETLLNDIDGLSTNLKEFEDKAGASREAFKVMTNTWRFQTQKFKSVWDTLVVSVSDAFIKDLQPRLENANVILEELTNIGWGNIGKAIIENIDLLKKPIAVLGKTLGTLFTSGTMSSMQALWNSDNLRKILLAPLESMAENIVLTLMAIWTETRANFTIPFEAMMNKTVQFIRNSYLNLLTIIPQAISNTLNNIQGMFNSIISLMNNIPGIDIPTIPPETLSAPFDDAINHIESLMDESDYDQIAQDKIDTIRAGWLEAHDSMKSDTDDWSEGVQGSLDELEEAFSEYYTAITTKAKESGEEIGEAIQEGIELGLRGDDVSIPPELLEKVKIPQIEYVKTWNESYEEIKEKATEFNEQMQEIGGQLLTSFTGMTSAMKAEVEARFQNELNALKETDKYRNASAEERENMEKNLNKKFAGERLKLWKMEKKAKIGEAIMGIAHSIISALELGPILGPIMATVIGAMGAVQLNAIKSTKPPKFQRGGLIGGQLHSQGGTMIEAERGEFILNRDAVNRIGVSGLNAINQGGGAVNVNISAPLLDDTIVDSIIPKIKEAVRRGSDMGV